MKFSSLIRGEHGVGVTKLVAGARDIRFAADQCYRARCERRWERGS
jgi:hypothetical protein